MTPEDLAAIRARADAADRATDAPDDNDWAMAVSSSAADVPALLAEVERLTSDLAAAAEGERFSYDDCRPDCDCGGHEGPRSCDCHVTGAEARERITQAEAERDSYLTVVREVLRQHYLAEIRCDHERQRDNPRCACSLTHLGWHPSVGSAVDAWIDHVLAAVDALPKETTDGPS